VTVCAADQSALKQLNVANALCRNLTATAERQGGEMRVLTMENEAVLANDIAAGLKAAGFCAQICYNGVAA